MDSSPPKPSIGRSSIDAVDFSENASTLRSIFDEAGIGISVVGFDRRPIHVNRQLCLMLGYSESELQKMTFDEFTHPDDVKTDTELFKELLEGKRSRYQIEKRFIAKDGQVCWGKLTASLAHRSDGSPLFAIGMVEDINEQKRAVEELAKSERRYRSVLENSTQVIWRADRFGAVIEAPKWCEITGQTDEEIKEHGWLNAIHPDDRDRVAAHWFEVLEGKAQYDIEYRLRMVDRSYRRYAACGVPIANESGEIVEWVGTCVDIEERYRAQESLQNERTFLRTVLDSLDEAIVTCDKSGKLTLANESARRLGLFGNNLQTLEQMLNEHAVWYRDHKSAMPREEVPIFRVLCGSKVRNASFMLKHERDGWKHFLANSEPIYDSSKQIAGAVIAINDVTEQRELEEQFYQSQKMEAIGQLAGGVAHDFNNLLTIINGSADLLLKRLELDQRSRSLVEQIRTAGERSSSLTQQLLAFSRKQVISPRTLDLNAEVAEAEKMLRRIIGEDIEMTIYLSDAGSVVLDPSLLDQALMNLVVNARDAMPRGGKLLIRTYRHAQQERNMNGEKVEGKERIYNVVEVADTGEGMTEEVKRRIFEPFFTTKGVKKGTGLGLATVYGIVKQAGGWVEVDSAVGQGSTFKLFFPDEQSKPSKPADAEGVAGLPRGTETILLVEDEEGVRTLVRDILEDCGYTVLVAHDGASALNVAREFPSSIDLLITDVVMPGVGGRAVCELLRGVRPELKVLFISGYTDDAVVRHGIIHQDVNFLHKPFNLGELTHKIREILDAPVKQAAN